MASTAGFRHNRLKRRHLEDDMMGGRAEMFPPENKRYFSEKIAQEMGVLKLDDHATVPQSIGSPQSPYSSSPPQTFTPPPSPFHNTSYQPSSPAPFSFSSSSPQSSPSPFSNLSSQQSSANVFSQRFTSQNFQNQLQQLHQLHHPVNQYQLQQQLQNHQLFQMRQPSSPPSAPTSPIATFEKPSRLEPKALALIQPFTEKLENPKKPELAVKEEDLEESEEEEVEKEETNPAFIVNLPEFREPERLIPLRHEDTSKALILYSSPTEVIQSSLNAAKERRLAKEYLKMQEKYPQAEAMEDLEPVASSPFFGPPPPSFANIPTSSPFLSFNNTQPPPSAYPPTSLPPGFSSSPFPTPQAYSASFPSAFSPSPAQPPLSPSYAPAFPQFNASLSSLPPASSPSPFLSSFNTSAQSSTLNSTDDSMVD